MNGSLLVNVHSGNKKSFQQIVEKCVSHLKKDEANKSITIRGKFPIISRAISIAEAVKTQVPNMAQYTKINNLDDKSKNRRRNIKITIDLVKQY